MLQCYICPSRCLFVFGCFSIVIIIAGASASLLEWYCEEETENCEERGVGSYNCIPHARCKLASTTWGPQLRHVKCTGSTWQMSPEIGVLRNHVCLCDRLIASNSEGSSPILFLANLNTLWIVRVCYCNIMLADIFLEVLLLRDGRGLIWI